MVLIKSYEIMYKNILCNDKTVYSKLLMVYTIFTIRILTPELLTIIVLKFEQVQFTKLCLKIAG